MKLIEIDYNLGCFDLGIVGIDEVLLVSSTTLVLLPTVFFDGAGSASWSFAIPGGVAGQQVNAQLFSLSLAGWDSSRAIEVVRRGLLKRDLDPTARHTGAKRSAMRAR